MIAIVRKSSTATIPSRCSTSYAKTIITSIIIVSPTIVTATKHMACMSFSE